MSARGILYNYIVFIIDRAENLKKRSALDLFLMTYILFMKLETKENFLENTPKIVYNHKEKFVPVPGKMQK